MSILKFEKRTPRNIFEMYSYITDPTKTDGNCLFGIGVNEFCADIEMYNIHKIFKYFNYAHPYIQVILSFEENCNKELNLLVDISRKVAEIIISGNPYTQVLGALHYDKPEHLHVHMMINSITVKGDLFIQKRHMLWYKHEINKILVASGVSPILSPIV